MAQGISRPYRLTKRPLGKILVDGEFISCADLERAIKEQNHTSELLGEVLVRLGLIDPADLKAALSVQGELASFEEAVRAAAGVRELLGNLLVRARRLSHEQLEQALRTQKETGEKLGVVLVRLGFLTERELDAALAFQQSQGDLTKVAAFRLGEILIAAGYISREQLEDALGRQRISRKKLGEVLLEAGYIESRHVEHGLRLQHMLVTAALIAALSLSATPDVKAAGAGVPGSSTAKVIVTATVLPRASLKILHQAPELVITNADIMRGYVEVMSASRFVVKNNSRAGFILTFEGLCSPFREVHVQGLGSEVVIGAGAGLIPQPFSRGEVAMELSYRFLLSEKAEPGTYAWPLMISAQPL